MGYDLVDDVDGIPTPLKIMSSSVGMIIPKIWKNKSHFQTTNQWWQSQGNMRNDVGQTMPSRHHPSDWEGFIVYTTYQHGRAGGFPNL